MSVYFAAIVLEILGLPIEMELAKDNVAECHCQRRIGALFGIEPEIRELGGSE